MSRSRAISLLIALMPLAFVACGCDPAFTYQPVNPDGVHVAHHSQVIDGVRLVAERERYFIDKSVLGHPIHIRNMTDKPVVVFRQQLTINGRTFDAEIANNAANIQARTVEPWETGIIYPPCKLDKPVREALSFDITWTWQLRIGKAKHTWQVPMRFVQP
jgi:hypothetical protein